MTKKIFFTFFFSFSFFFFSAVASSVFANSGCAVTRIGNPSDTAPTLPPECSFSSGGLPSDTTCFSIGAENPFGYTGVPGKYCNLPPAVTNTTRSVFYNEPAAPKLYEKRIQSNKWQDWGSEEMIKVIYEVAQKWRNGSPANAHRPAIPPHPNGWIIVQDITSDYHSEHIWGVAVDIFATPDGRSCAASDKYFGPGTSSGNWRCPYGPNNSAETVNLGKLIVDTGYLNVIWHSDRPANDAILRYANAVDPNRYPYYPQSGGYGLTGIRPVTEPHYDHMHLLVDRSEEKERWYYRNFQRSKLLDCNDLTGIQRVVCYP